MTFVPTFLSVIHRSSSKIGLLADLISPICLKVSGSNRWSHITTLPIQTVYRIYVKSLFVNTIISFTSCIALSSVTYIRIVFSEYLILFSVSANFPLNVVLLSGRQRVDFRIGLPSFLCPKMSISSCGRFGNIGII